MTEFHGRGWSFPVGADGGTVDTAAGEESIRQSIRLILSTAPGERVMRPDFGCGIHAFAFDAVDTTRLTLIEDEVRDALVTWEPRVEVLDVEAALADGATGRLEVDVSYRVRRTNNEFNLVYPFYLGGGGRA